MTVTASGLYTGLGLVGVLSAALAVLAWVLSQRIYPRGRQVEYRVRRTGSSRRAAGTGEILGFSGSRVRVRCLSWGHEYTLPLTSVKRR